MGSKPWRAVTAFVPDMGVALENAQRETFARGEFGFTYAMTQLYRSMGEEPPTFPPERKASSIEEARELGDASGTCSVLDVYELGEQPEPGVAGPLTIAARCPTNEDIEAALPELYENLDRGEAGYLVCHENGTPVSIWFIGMSFD